MNCGHVHLDIALGLVRHFYSGGAILELSWDFAVHVSVLNNFDAHRSVLLNQLVVVSVCYNGRKLVGQSLDFPSCAPEHLLCYVFVQILHEGGVLVFSVVPLHICSDHVIPDLSEGG